PARRGHRAHRSGVRGGATVSGPERRRRRRRVGEQPAAGRVAGAWRTPCRADVSARPGPVDRQRGDDRRRRVPEIPRRVDGVLRSQRGRRPGVVTYQFTNLPSHQFTNSPIHQVLVHTDYLLFNTKQRQEFIRITDEVAAIVKKSGVKEGTALVSAMHITSGVYVNDWEDGLIHDFQVWLEKLAPSGLDYRHHQ